MLSSLQFSVKSHNRSLPKAYARLYHRIARAARRISTELAMENHADDPENKKTLADGC